jgi:predicted aconitase
LVGSRSGSRVPAIHGIPPSATSDQLKTFGAGAASAGSVALFHVIGLTPEARIQDPFGGVSPDEVVTVTRAELDGMASRISTAAPGEKVDMVTLGCPLLSVEELKGVAAKMPARRVRKDMHFWMYLAGERRTSWGLV